jgi:hypothetical protein
MMRFLAHPRVGLLRRRTDNADNLHNDPLLGWMYVEPDGPYKRSSKEAWLNAQAGEIERDLKFGLKNVKGYDICLFLRDWLGED